MNFSLRGPRKPYNQSSLSKIHNDRVRVGAELTTWNWSFGRRMDFFNSRSSLEVARALRVNKVRSTGCFLLLYVFLNLNFKPEKDRELEEKKKQEARSTL